MLRAEIIPTLDCNGVFDESPYFGPVMRKPILTPIKVSEPLSPESAPLNYEEFVLLEKIVKTQKHYITLFIYVSRDLIRGNADYFIEKNYPLVWSYATRTER